MVEELIEEGTGKSLEALWEVHGIEVVDAVEGEIALLLDGELFSTYDHPFEDIDLVADINYIIREDL